MKVGTELNELNANESLYSNQSDDTGTNRRFGLSGRTHLIFSVVHTAHWLRGETAKKAFQIPTLSPRASQQPAPGPFAGRCTISPVCCAAHSSALCTAQEILANQEVDGGKAASASRPQGNRYELRKGKGSDSAHPYSIPRSSLT